MASIIWYIAGVGGKKTMAQLDLCLAQMAKETTLSYQDDFYEMYKFVSNSDLRLRLHESSDIMAQSQ